MSTDQQKENSYVLPTESAAEMAHLINQDQAVTEVMDRLFPTDLDLTSVRRVLDIATRSPCSNR